MSGSDWGTHSKSCCKTPLGNMAVSTAWQISRGPATSPIIPVGVWNVFRHTWYWYTYISRAEEVMRECDIQYTRSIKTNSGVNLRRKPGLDLCCDLLQHLQGVPRACSFWVFTSYHISTSILLASLRTRTQIVFHTRWNVTRLCGWQFIFWKRSC